MTPLEYMLAVMNDPAAAPERRDRMAIAAAPYVHTRAAERKPGKKDQARLDAEMAGSSSNAWGDDLEPRALN